MRALAQTYPPLGQVTPLEDGLVPLTAVLEVTNPQASDTWEVSIWHSVDGRAWSGAQLEHVQDQSEPQCLHPASSSRRYYYNRSFSFERSLNFTLRYRRLSKAEWTWARDEQNLRDGVVVRQAPDRSSEELGNLIQGLDSNWEVSSCLSQTPRTLLWSLEAEVSRVGYHPEEGTDDDASTYRDVSLGIPRDSILRWFALVRHSCAWLAPRQGDEHFSLDKDAILCAFLTSQGRCIIFLGLGGINNVCSVLRSTADGRLSVHILSDADGQTEEKATVLVAESADLERAVAAVVYHARTLAWKSRSAPVDDQAQGTLEAGKRESWLDGLGFCTWNSLGQQLTEEKVLHALDSLAASNIHITNFIMDDNWQSIDYKGQTQFDYGWVDFEADPQSFPHGLKATISKIRESHPNIQHIAVWHALLGYWGGIAPDGKLAKAYKTLELSREDDDLPLGDTMTVVHEDDVPRFYGDFYNFLADAGIDAVKTDAQFMVDTWTSPKARRSLLFTYLDNWSLAAYRHFRMRAVACMSLFPQWLFHLPLSSPPRPSYPVRSSDDFFPDVPASHAWHVWANAHNCLMLRPLGVLPDWDMFQSAHECAGFHAAARCISGGPVYITDVPGEHDVDIIRQISGRTPNGKTIIFRPSVVGRAMSPFVGYEDNTLLKVGSYHGASDGNPLMGVFNVSNGPLTEVIPLSSFSGTIDSKEYVARAHTTGVVSSPTKLGDSSGSLLTLSLDVRGYDILTAFPLTSIPRNSDRGTMAAVANLGLVDKMTGCVAITSNLIKRQENGRIAVYSNLRALGILGVYISYLPELSIDRDFMITIQGRSVPVHTVKVSERDGHVLEVDVEKAWEEMELESGRGDEIEVKVNFAG